jgi:amino acid adenylation domain-containing protein
MLKSAQQENPSLIGQVVQIESGMSIERAQSVLEQETSQAITDRLVRYVDGHRYVQQLREVSAPPAANALFKHDGVYLLTGGAGGLGLIFAREIAQHAPGVRLVLTGRSTLNQTQRAAIEALKAMGAQVDYDSVDVADRAAIKQLLQRIQTRHGQLTGIVHSAGVIRDSFLIKKTPEELRAVLAAKVHGLVNLDEASRGLRLELFVVFSSSSAVFGQVGQTDYAAANAFMDAYAQRRQAQVEAGLGHGRTVSINWPLWANGGMQTDAQSVERIRARFGVVPLSDERGIRAFYDCVAHEGAQVTVVSRQVSREQASLSVPASAKATAGSVVPAAEVLQDMALRFVKKLLSGALGLSVDRLDPEASFEQYGMDSVRILQITNELEKTFGSLSKTLFFEYQSINAITGYFLRDHEARLRSVLGMEEQALLSKSPNVPSGVAKGAVPTPRLRSSLKVVRPAAPSEGIAIIGLTGRYPQARTLAEFWENLKAGRDSITEIPVERWDHQQYFDAQKGKLGKSYSKWGGFIEGVDQFDPLFFNIAPRDALFMDPQQRLFLEIVWTLLESVGYTRELLQREYQSKVGLYVGSMYQQYNLLRADIVTESAVALASYSAIANRTSHFFGLQGPSVAIDTMCSSAAIAIHIACNDLRNGECQLAIVGGVNLTIEPKKYLALSQAQLIGSHPGSRSFADADGYLPAEIVSAVMLKPLSRAEADADRILAVIRSTAVNHGGRSIGYSVPSPSAQAAVIESALKKANIDASAIGYVEAAAVGSALGDSIELAALNSVFGRDASDRSCAIGAVKSNIGHGEAASCMSQLAKVVLQLWHKQFVPTIFTAAENPDIHFDQSAFKLQRLLSDWPASDEAKPRCALINSFGAGGSNASIVIEEYVDKRAPLRNSPHRRPLVFVFSARDAERLRVVVAQYTTWLERESDVDLADLAYTLQSGREALAARLALVASGREELIAALEAHITGDKQYRGVLLTNDLSAEESPIKALSEGSNGEAVIRLLLKARDLEKVALLWTQGVRIDWSQLQDGERRLLPDLPTYPFAPERYWITSTAAKDLPAQPVEVAAVQLVVETGSSLETEVREFLIGFACQALSLSREKLRITLDLQDYGMDSLLSMHLVRAASQAFGIRLTGRAMLEHRSIGALTDFILQQIESLSAIVVDSPVSLATEEIITETGSPLSEGQKGLWILYKLAPDVSVYNIPICIRTPDAFNLDVLRTAYRHVLEQHPLLSCVIAERDGLPYLVQRNGTAPSIQVEDISDRAEHEYPSIVAERVKAPISLENGPLIRTSALSCGAAGHMLLIVVHHIVFDRSSMMLLLDSLLGSYGRLLAGEQLLLESRATYTNFVAWERQMLSSTAEGSREYWMRQLAGTLPILELPTDRPRSLATTIKGRTATRLLTTEMTADVRKVASSQRVNISALLLGAYKMLLWRYSGETDLIVGMPTSLRPQERFDRVVGYFINMVALRTKLEPQSDFSTFLRSVQLNLADALDHCAYPFAHVVRDLKVPRAAHRTPIFQVAFEFQNATMQRQGSDISHDAAEQVQLLPGLHQEGEFELVLEIVERPNTLVLNLKYHAQLFDASTIEAMLDQYVHLLLNVTSNLFAPLHQYIVAPPDQLVRLLTDWNATQREYPQECVHDLFVRQAVLTPNSPAVSFQQRTVTYRELEEQSRQLAQYLVRLGVQPESLVALHVERGIEMLVCFLGILRAGAAYVPLDPSFPEARLRYMLEDSRACVLITQQSLHNRIGSSVPAATTVVLMDSDRELIQSTLDPVELSKVNVKSLAYVMYTSGSTGKPKGVMVDHRALTNFLISMAQRPGVRASDRLLAVTTFSFDIAGLELYLPLIAGAHCIVCPTEVSRNPEWLMRELDQTRPTVMQATPSTWTMLFQAGWRNEQGVRVFCGGEALTPALRRAFIESGCELWNVFGPTETTIWSTLDHLESHDATTIGKPIANTQIYIVDEWLQPQPVGIPGELCIAGDGLARGYLNQPELTRTKFIDNPFTPGTKLYRTGDRARWRSDGRIDWLSRLDAQLKVRGHRIEPGEIEAALVALAGVKQAVVVAREIDDSAKSLVAYCVGALHEAPSESSLRELLCKSLPEYMVPSAFVFLPQLPLTPNGKIDRNALPAPNTAPLGERYVAPRTPVEEVLAQVWTDVLRIPKVGVQDNFFAVGGDSIMAIQIVARSAQSGLQLSVQDVFEQQSVEKLAMVAVAMAQEELDSAHGIVPLTPLQRHLVSDQLMALRAEYVVFKLTERISLEMMRAAIVGLIAHHDALRLQFRRGETGWHQQLGVIETLDQLVPLESIDLSDVPIADREAAITSEVQRLSERMDFASGIVVRFALMDFGSSCEQSLAVVAHPLTMDPESWLILGEDLRALFDQLLNGGMPTLTARTNSFKRWAERLASRIESEVTSSNQVPWRNLPWHENVALPRLDLVPTQAVTDLYRFETTLSAIETQALVDEVVPVLRASLGQVLVASLVDAFALWTGSRLLAIDFEDVERGSVFDDFDVSRTIGCFANRYPLLIDARSVTSVDETVRIAKEHLKEVPVYAVDAWTDMPRSAFLQHIPMPDVSFSCRHLGVAKCRTRSSLQVVKFGRARCDAASRQHIEIHAAMVEGCIRFTWVCNGAIYDRVKIREVADHQLEVFRKLIEHCEDADGDYELSDFRLIEIGE